MILIKSIDYLEVPGDQLKLMHAVSRDPYGSTIGTGRDGKEALSNEYISEIIHGMRLVRSDGEEIVFGVGQEVGKIIGVSYEAHKQLVDSSKWALGAAGEARERLQKIYTAPLWQRIKWVFTGVKQEEGERRRAATAADIATRLSRS